MIARIVTVVRMRVRDWRPALRRMAGITFRYGHEMIIPALRRTAGRRGAVMAGTATTGNPLVIPRATHEGCCGMAGGAILVGRYVIRRHAGCRNPVAGSAIVDDAGVIERRRYEGTDGVANAAILAGRKMTGWFARGEPGIVTRCAVVDDTGVVERRGQEARGYVAVAAVTTRRHMVVGLSGGGIAVVTRCAIINDALMIEPCARE